MDADGAQLTAIARALAGRRARPEGREVRFLCPAHQDRHPSARWNPEKQTWFCDACKAGGGWRPLAQGGWAWNLAEVERVPYRLPETLAAARGGGVVFVVEGEKDADRLASLGLAATTNAGGAGKWRASYSAALRGARVVIVPDRDVAGRRHAETVRASLQGFAAEVRLLELQGLPDKGDVSDWIAGRELDGRGPGDIRRELVELAARAAVVAPVGGAAAVAPGGRVAAVAASGGAAAAAAAVLAATATAPASMPGAAPAGRRSRVRRASDIAPQAVTFLWCPYVPCGKLTLLEGDPGQGKSWIAAALATAGSRGEGLPGAAAFAPFRTLIFTAEDGLADTLRPRLDRLGADCDAVLLHDEPLDLAQGEDVAEVEQAVAEHRPRLVILDPIVAYLGAKTDAYRANEVRAILAPLARLADRHACAVLAVRHLNKSRGSRSIYAGQGSIDFTAAARSVLLAGCGGDGDAERALVHIKSNLAAIGETVAYAIDEKGFRWAGASPLRASDLLAPEATGEDASALDEARAFLRGELRDGPVSTAEIWTRAREARISEHTLRRAKAREGVIACRQGYGPGGSWRWSLAGRGAGGRVTAAAWTVESTIASSWRRRRRGER
jgi:putative DNA primase/helicase